MTEVTDPVCGMQIDPEKAASKAEYQGQTYNFCSDDCKKAFQAEPSKYAKSPEDHGHRGQP